MAFGLLGDCLGDFLLKIFCFCLYIGIMAGRWQCRYTTDDFVLEMAREMYLRDWRLGMRNAHWIIQAFHRKEYLDNI
jgi:hypothetical protein